eukprot:2500779-Rhodomonas_salina.1
MSGIERGGGKERYVEQAVDAHGQVLARVIRVDQHRQQPGTHTTLSQLQQIWAWKRGNQLKNCGQAHEWRKGTRREGEHGRVQSQVEL